MRANTQTIAVLKHSLRSEPKAQELEKKLPGPKMLERCRKYGHSITNVAACFAVLLLMKIGVFPSMNQFHNQGQRVMKQYYAKQVGEDLADEVFPNDIKPSSTSSSRGLSNA
jgi:flagellar biosynthesis/type III secretory pathway M-ring protein FliF/YscJ